MNIIINRSDALGDILLTLPMAQLIKENKPKARIIFIVSKNGHSFFKNNPFVDEVWVFDHRESFFRNVWIFFNKFKKISPDCYFYVGGSYIPSLVAFLLKTPFRGGIKSKWQSLLLLNQGLRQHRSLVTMHEADYNLNLLEPLGISYPFAHRDNYKPQIYLDSEEVESAIKDLKHFLKEEKKIWREFVVIHPGMTGHTLNWPSRKYAQFIIQFERRNPGKYLFLISFTQSDGKYLREIRSELANPDYKNFLDRVCFFDGSVKGLRNYMAVLSQAKLFLGPSTGPTHIANALNVKLISLYSPIKVQSALRWAPFDLSEKMTRIMVPDVVCGENKACAGASCPYFECMRRIEVEDIVQAAMEFMKEGE